MEARTQRGELTAALDDRPCYAERDSERSALLDGDRVESSIAGHAARIIDEQPRALPIQYLRSTDRHGTEREICARRHVESRDACVDHDSASSRFEVNGDRRRHRSRVMPRQIESGRPVAAELEVEQNPLDGSIRPSIEHPGLQRRSGAAIVPQAQSLVLAADAPRKRHTEGDRL